MFKRTAIYLTMALSAVTLAACSSGNSGTQGVEMAPMPRHTSIADLDASSDIAVVGTVTKVMGQEQAPSVGMVLTNYEFTIDRFLSDHGQKHKGAKNVVVHEPGGTLPNGKTLAVDGSVHLSVGEKDILFLHEYSPGYFYVVGMDGKFDVSSAGMVAPGPENLLKFSGTVDQLAAQIPSS